MLPRALAPALLAVAVLAPLAGAQVPGAACDVTVSAMSAGVAHQPGQTLEYGVQVATTNPLGGQATLTVATATAGWNATVEPASIPVTSTTPGSATLRVTAPPSGGAAAAEISVTADLACAPVPGAPTPLTGRGQAVLRPTLAATAGPLGPAEGPVPPALLAVAAMAVLAAGGAAALMTRRRALALSVADPRRDVPPGGGASFAITATNATREPAEAVVEVGDLPPGWRLVAPPRELRLEPRGAATFQLLVRSPADAKPGDAAIVEVRARAPRGRPAVTSVQAFVVGEGGPPPAARAPAAEPPPAPGPRPAVVVRDEQSLARERRRRR